MSYTKLFEEFWVTYPRRVAKAPAFKAWQKQVDEDDAFMARAVIDDLKKRTRLGFWSSDKTKIPHAATWINARRWEDEGWEDEIKSRGKEDTHTPYTPTYDRPIEEEYDLDSWQLMLNRVMRSYIMAARGVSDRVLELLKQVKNEVHAECIQGVNEEIALAEDKSKARNEMAHMMVALMLSRFDHASGLQLKNRIIAGGKQR